MYRNKQPTHGELGSFLECPGECVCARAAVCVSVIAPAECDQLVSECAPLCVLGVNTATGPTITWRPTVKKLKSKPLSL